MYVHCRSHEGLICDAGWEWEVFAWSVTKCHGSWVCVWVVGVCVGRGYVWVVGVCVGRGYVWVNVMGKKKFSKKIKN